ncbi:MAG: hypothetical protein K2I94_01285, partial [Muribaculaceae bacterium]|nr:hypothetical protein [Muribaculaceae bacterium]
MFKKNKFLLGLVISLSLLSSCSKPANIAGKVNGVWETEWKDDISNDDVDEIRVTELLYLKDAGSVNGGGNYGNFTQIFSGEVDYDDWEYEQTINYEVGINGTFHIFHNNKIQLKYDLESMEVATGKSDVSVDFSSAALDLFSGDWGSALVKGI